MITYIRDIDKSYDLKIKTLLRSHNAKFVEKNNQTDCIYLYALDQEKLVGSLTVSFTWDWATIGAIYYINHDVLNQLVYKAFEYYKDKVVGIKLFTQDQDQFNDFLNVGFVHVNTIDFSDGKKYYIADLYSKEEKLLNTYKFIETFEPIEDFQNNVDDHIKEFNQRNQIPDLTEVFDIVVLDNDSFIGGIQSELYGNTLYVNRLVVDENYRKISIGSKLMEKVIDFAKMNNVQLIQLGTSGFQARGFYEKFGFQVVHTRNDNPKGYNNYTMIKYL